MGFFRFLRHLLRRKYNFLPQNQLPDSVHSLALPGWEHSWAVTGDFPQAKNHCAAVCLTNAMIYYRLGGGEELFPPIHRRLGNGPVLSLRKAKRWLNLRKLRNIDRLKAALEQNHPCALMLALPNGEWHWVLALGWQESADERLYLRIADGWHREADRFYPVIPGSEWLSAVELYLK